MTTVFFDHEKLHVYNAAIEFVVWTTDLLQAVTQKAAVRDQLDRASTSIPLNIAEGNGKYSLKDRSRFLDIARGSAVECAACLDVFVARKLVREEDIIPGKERLRAIVNMLVGLIQSVADRVREETVTYMVAECEGDGEFEHEHEHE